ncbi:hypothetical protein E1B28_013881 [Marasmius oreades]|uniref:Uncharacterized protein n=1 Tax=Marasmius oreades TaxID=181124 RepID=A0A9P7RJM1_9AGAR|nr:uncharacterized protein E1B28_013881 [Marasmius oreades]KAG7085284.1 hypothetical protein E1B28_013881 [Marasmius oreades]
MALATAAKKWMDDRAERKKAEDTDRRVATIQHKLLATGCNLHDIDAISGHHLVKTCAPLKELDWAYHVLPQLKVVIDEDRRARMFEGHLLDHVMTYRVTLVKSFFYNLLSSVASKRRDLPDPQTVCLLPICADLIILPDNIPVTEQTLIINRAAIVRDLRAWVQEERRRLFEAFVEGRHRLVVAAVGLGLLKEFLPLVTGWCLNNACHELAVAQFTCQQCGTLCPSARGAIRHLNNAYFCKPSADLAGKKFTFTPTSTAIHLLILCGLSVMTTTADHLDQYDTSFKCLNCYTDYVHVGKWRTCIDHHDRYHGATVPRFEPVTKSEDRNESRHWACARCSVFYSGTRREVVELHAKELHGVKRPRVPGDLVYIEQ